MRSIVMSIMLSLLLCGSVLAAPASVSTGLLSSDTVVFRGKCTLTGVQIVTDGTNNAMVVIYDAMEAEGKAVAKITVVGADYYGGRTFQNLRMSNGIYVDITGTGAQVIIDYVDSQ